jgi:hypothetical protein
MKTKNVNLCKTDESPCWTARYRVKVHHPVRGVITRHRHISTLLPATEANRAAAQKIANDRRDEDVRRFWAAVHAPGTGCGVDRVGRVVHSKQTLPTTLRDSFPTLAGQIVEVADVFLTVVTKAGLPLTLHFVK